LEYWLTPLKQMAGGTAGEEYLKSLETWETAVRKALDAQGEWARLWAEAVSGGKVPNEAWAGQAEGLMKTWTETNRELWERWMAGFKAMAPSVGAGTEMWQKQTEVVMKAWQEAVQSTQKFYSETGTREGG
jgi:hypothetical protein